MRRADGGFSLLLLLLFFVSLPFAVGDGQTDGSSLVDLRPRRGRLRGDGSRRLAVLLLRDGADLQIALFDHTARAVNGNPLDIRDIGLFHLLPLADRNVNRLPFADACAAARIL